MEGEVVIRVESVYKDFILPHERTGTVKGVFTSMFSKATRIKEKQHALKDISFEIKKGEFFGIVGRNGSGKSTLLKILAAIYQPTKGKIYTSGKLVPFIELGVGFNPELSGRDNIYLNGAILGFSVIEIDSMYESIVEFAELERFMDQKLKNYSSGMQVRLAFSMAVRANADILLVDEVLAVGDDDFKRKCYDYFKTLKKQKKTVVFVSHDMDAVREYCDRALLIDDSRIKDMGKTSTITQEYSELFLKDTGREKALNNPKTDKRTGSGVVTISDIKLNKGIFTHEDDFIELSLTLEGVGPNSNLMSGFAVKNVQGLYINGSHTWEQGEKLPDLSPKKKIGIQWQIPNIFEDGLYTIDVFTNGSGNEVYEKLEDATSFRVKRPTKSGCLVTVPVNVTTNNVNG